MSGESRQELLAWLNDLLQLNYTKIEQVGTGAAICQIFDSIYGDVQMSKVKFNTVQEYEYVNNFKVLQKAFTDHQVDKVIPVERLVKCRFQDNLEFLQWVKKYWDTFFPGGAYDAIARRKGGSATGMASGMVKPAATTGMKKTLSNSSVDRAPKTVKSVAPARATVRTTPPAVRAAQSSGVDAMAFQELNRQVTQLQVTVDGLEKERDFYFGKLRDIEVAVQSRLDCEKEDSPMAQFCKEVQAVLYSTEEGFEVPQENQIPGNEMAAEEEVY